MGLVSQIHCPHQSDTSEPMQYVCVLNFSLFIFLLLIYCLSLIFPLLRPFPLSSFSLSAANPACVGVDNKLGVEERLEEIWSIGFSSAR